MAKESKTQLGALLMPIGGSSLPVGRLVKLTDDLESIRELTCCKTIEHLSIGWAAGSCPGCVHGRGRACWQEKPYFLVFQGN